jgi:hypothetical protein
MKHLLRYSFLLLIFSPAFGYAQKAYDVVKYTGKVQNMVVHFTLADGYLAACNIRVQNTSTHKQTLFLPESGEADENKILKFYNTAQSTSYFAVNGLLAAFNEPPAKLSAFYYSNGKAHPFILRR